MQGVHDKKKSTSVLEFVALFSPTAATTACSCRNYAVINLAERAGAAARRRQRHRARRRPIRHARSGSIPNLLQARGLTPRTSSTSSSSRAGGRGRPGRRAAGAEGAGLPVYAQRQRPPQRRADFENIIVKVDPAARRPHHAACATSARVELGAQTYSQSFISDGRPATGIAIYSAARGERDRRSRRNRRQDGRRSPRASRRASNMRAVRHRPNSSRPRSTKSIDADRGGVLVLIVILVFLQDWRAMLVPATTVPVTIIGAFAAMAALGFTVNLSTLFAIVLAIGIVVDDAIVIVEGVARHIEAGLPGQRGGREGDGRAVRPRHRHHAGADVGVPPGRLPARPDRPALPPVRAGHRRDRLHQRDQRHDAEADAMRAVAAAAGPAGEAQLLLSRLQQGL